jgi:UDP-2,3-diacylglucosamine hydrolase
MSSAYFVSDLHLTDPEGDRSHLFERFLNSLSGDQGVSHLFLLGDVFDLWVADHEYFIVRYPRLIEQIRRLVTEGVEVHYFEGNHDLHLESFWARQLSVRVHGGPLELDLGPLRLRLEHGDQMDPEDRGYRFLRWFLRTPPVRFLIEHLPGGLLARIGDRASATSRQYTSRTKTIDERKAREVIRHHARRAFAQRPFDVIISGHVHVRDDHRNEDQGWRSINLGTWLERPCCLRIEGRSIEWIELPDGLSPDLRETPESAPNQDPAASTAAGAPGAVRENAR